MRMTTDVAQPDYDVLPKLIQEYGTLRVLPLGLHENARSQSVAPLNQALADTITLRDLYKKHHWQMSGETFYALHLLLDKHFDAQSEIVDSIAERVMALGGISLAMAHDVAETTRVARPPRGREDVPTQLSRLLKAHELILVYAREAAAKASEVGDEGTNDLLISEVVRVGEAQVWFLAEHLAATPLRAEER